MSKGEVVLSLREVAFAYPGASAQTLEKIDLDIYRGERVALLGKNGSGKSTIAKIINALLLPTQGACLVCGIDTKDDKVRHLVHQKSAIVFQNPDDQIVASTVEEDTAFGPENLQLPTEEIERRVDCALEAVGLLHLRRAGSYTLSGGQKQRLALAGALALEPEILVLDEATSMLDPQARAEFAKRLDLLRASGMTLIQITHLMDEAAAADRVVIIDKGEVAWMGTPDELFKQRDDRWRFDTPTEIEMWSQLCEHGLISRTTPRSVSAMIEALCL